MHAYTYKPLLAALVLACLASPQAMAQVSPEEAARLDKDLTPMGAERAGNADGSIPAWSGKWLGTPPHVKFDGTGHKRPDPYAGEQPLFTITAANLEQYKDKLSEGQVALLKRYPDTYRIRVYPSHRDFRYSPVVEANIRQNALGAELINDGYGVANAFGGAPFPIPKNGFELMWNQNLSARAWKEEATYKMALVLANNNRVGETVGYQILSLWDDPNGSLATYDGTQACAMVSTQEPARKKGEIILSCDFSDPIAKPRQAWQYLPGNRRVRRAPTIGYDTPYGAGGFRVMDEDRLFNGAPDRYDWKLVGKQEMFIPYNNYALDDPDLPASELTAGTGHINPDHVRFELHRVWVLEANLKEGKRHIYGKRRFYIDEDSWAAVLGDNYDGKGQLWRTNIQTSVYAYEVEAFHARVAVYHDLLAGSYLADRLVNGLAPARLNDADYDASYFTAANLRKLGK
ncbi:uncharacterized protein DUF1329 [Pseudomonas sp. SLBN-26]|uniref:DUF1329 domain-containing protein n=1 Tax=Pseudomonadaceae TaxID=135621 RepID=UPI001153E833|nr:MULTISPECIES: DUF1329 domain-containing protein [Pseudomonas]MCP1618107.1 hypothetical protein [Pseudomonas otitidis]TQL07345.1 uncharacterized protein DUF1329 [Pseudomonas sp. SLBN-26]